MLLSARMKQVLLPLQLWRQERHTVNLGFFLTELLNHRHWLVIISMCHFTCQPLYCCARHSWCCWSETGLCPGNMCFCRCGRRWRSGSLKPFRDLWKRRALTWEREDGWQSEEKLKSYHRWGACSGPGMLQSDLGDKTKKSLGLIILTGSCLARVSFLPR